MKFTIEYINQKGGNIKNVYKRGGSIAKNIELEPLEELKDVYYIKCTEKNSENVCKQISKEELDKDEQNINLINIYFIKIKDVTFPLIDEKDLDHFKLNGILENFEKDIINLELILKKKNEDLEKKKLKDQELNKKKNLEWIIYHLKNGGYTKLVGTSKGFEMGKFIHVKKENNKIEIYDLEENKYMDGFLDGLNVDDSDDEEEIDVESLYN